MTPAVEAAFALRDNDRAVQYVDYWEQHSARTDAEVFRRFLFAFMSVHTTWEINVLGYQAIKDFEEWRDKHFGLRTRLVRSGAGLHNNRTRWIDRFSDAFWAGPSEFRRRGRESWAAYRDRLEDRIVGLGPAKVSFALELCWPLEAEVVCLDVHMLRLYGKTAADAPKANVYHRLEADWVGRARAAQLPPFIVKQIHWDRMQGRPNSRYWSHVFEQQGARP